MFPSTVVDKAEAETALKLLFSDGADTDELFLIEVKNTAK